MPELTASQKAIQIDKDFPHLNNHEIVLELAKIEDRLDKIEAVLKNTESIDTVASENAVQS